ncbi:TetR/AcrR family transcriptional regulator [Gorillibacterium sp. sgz5001074]|uniref:TetR/AcrR family transcriptional regulator n=1 Tax=Gorillibacterium sp. sgz5001074 TaxID=3446695 RepID=UPI003F66A596
MDKKIPLRERKKIQTRVSILDAFLSALESRPFHEIGIEDVCEAAHISKMTFFRYFTSKEEVLDYFVLRWCRQRSLEIQEATYQGMAGIRHVFQSASEIPSATKILVALLQYYSKLKEPPSNKNLSIYEHSLVAERADDALPLQVLPLRAIFIYYIDQTALPDERKTLIVDHLLTMFYGIPFQVYTGMIGATSLSDAYRDHLNLLLASLAVSGR